MSFPPKWPRFLPLFGRFSCLVVAARASTEDDCSLSLLQVGVRSFNHVSASRSLFGQEAATPEAAPTETVDEVSNTSTSTNTSNNLTSETVMPVSLIGCAAAEPPDTGFDREGGDLLARPVTGGVGSCVARCCSTTGCVAYVFAEAPSNYGLCVQGNDCCYMKSSVTEKRNSSYGKVATGLVRRPPAVGGPPADWPRSNSSIHDVVGEGGVLKITLDHRPEWEQREMGHISTEGEEDGYQKRTMSAAGIRPTVFRATDAFTASDEDIRNGCPLDTEPETAAFCQEHKKDGVGCKSRVESAIADSHRRALTAALQRNESDWTLIMEDDVVPMIPKQWSASFQDAWKDMEPKYKMVRMGWCTFEEDLGPVRKSSDVNHTGTFQLNNWMSWKGTDGGEHYYSGGCTSAYMVHREIIPELLSLFPCCCPLDCCLEHGLYYMPTNEPNLFRGQQVVMNMDTDSTAENTRHFTFFNQSGVLVQDNRRMRSTRPEFNRTAPAFHEFDRTAPALLEVPLHRNRTVSVEETQDGLIVATTTL